MRHTIARGQHGAWKRRVTHRKRADFKKRCFTQHSAPPLCYSIGKLLVGIWLTVFDIGFLARVGCQMIQPPLGIESMGLIARRSLASPMLVQNPITIC
jgi:hypothetical protein